MNELEADDLRDLLLLAEYLRRSTDRSTTVVLGASEATTSMAPGVIVCQDPSRWDAGRAGQSVILAIDVRDHPQWGSAAKLLADAYRRGAIIISTTRRHEQNLSDEYALPFDVESPAVFSMRARARVVGVHDVRLAQARDKKLKMQRPLCIFSMFNEEDIAASAVRHALNQGCDVHILDNGSTDATLQMLGGFAADSRVSYERFPKQGLHSDWRLIMARKSAIAFENGGRWIIHADADEQLYSPWPDVSLAEAFSLVSAYGANRVDFTMFLFPLISDSSKGGLGREHSCYFRFGDHPAHFLLKRAWYQGSRYADLAGSGGHEVQFEGAVDFPYKFLMKHYPIRSTEHGRRKVFKERRARWSPYEREVLGWHVHYDHYSDDCSFLEDIANLYHARSDTLLFDFGLFVISDIAGQYFFNSISSRPPLARSMSHAGNAD